MDTFFATSLDGTRIAYDCSGAGPAIILLHGGGSYRQEWHTAGYVQRLQSNFTVITLDLRGHGESDLPTDPADYTIDKQMQDIFAVADACGAKHFVLWGMSHGGKLGRHLAVQSDRVDKIILMGVRLGPGISSRLRQEILDFCAHWTPILQAQRDSTLDFESLSQNDQEFLQHFKVATMLGWGPAMLDLPSVEPADFHCPVLWLVGSEDEEALESVREYEAKLEGSPVQVQILAGLNHEQVFDEIDTVFPVMLAFTQSKTVR
jgi:pimeloyl-ACP methyl ester carboxylesterase